MHSCARSCPPPPPDKSQFVRLGIMIECLAGLRMRHLEERGGLRGLSVRTVGAPSARPLPSSSRSNVPAAARSHLRP